jgi:hypothetical protein
MTNGTYSGISLSEFLPLIHVYRRYPTPLGTPCYYGPGENSECLPVGRYWGQIPLVCLSYPITVVIQYVTLLAHSWFTWVNFAVISQAHCILERYLGSIDIYRAGSWCDQPSRPVDSHGLMVANRSPSGEPALASARLAFHWAKPRSARADTRRTVAPITLSLPS